MVSRRQALKGGAVLSVAGALGAFSLKQVLAETPQNLGKFKCTGIALDGGEAFAYLTGPTGSNATLILPNGPGIFKDGSYYLLTATLI